MAAQDLDVYKDLDKKYSNLLLMIVWANFTIELTKFLQIRGGIINTIKYFITGEIILNGNMNAPSGWSYDVPLGILFFILVATAFVKIVSSKRTAGFNSWALESRMSFIVCVLVAVFIRFVGFGVYYAGPFFSTEI